MRVWATGEAIEGELVRGRLEAEGIPVLLKGDGDGPYRSRVLFVPEDREADARAVLDAIASGSFAQDVDAAFAEDAGDERTRD